MTEPNRESRTSAFGLLGFLIVCLLIVSGIAIVSAFSAMGRQDFTGAGLCLVASALPLGLLVNALLKK